MRLYTAHLHPHRAAVLVREGFSWGAALFGPVWFAAHRAWIPAILTVAIGVVLLRLHAGPFLLAWAWLLGLHGFDLWRWSLARRGYGLAHVVAAADRDAALARLFAQHPALLPATVPAW